MPSPRKVSPAPSRSACTSFLNERSMAVGLARFAAVRREQIAGAAHGPDYRRVRRVGLDLTPDPRDPHVDGAVEGLALARLGEVEQTLTREDFLGVLRKGLQQGEFGACQRMLVAIVVAQH